MKIFYFLFAAFLLASCAATSQFIKFASGSAEPTKARIYLYRPSNFASAIKFQVFSNDQLIGKVGPKGYLCWEVPAGDLTITSKGENKEMIRLNAEAGQNYYIKQFPKMGIMTARVGMELVSEAEGQSAVAKLKPPKLLAQ